MTAAADTCNEEKMKSYRCGVEKKSSRCVYIVWGLVGNFARVRHPHENKTECLKQSRWRKTLQEVRLKVLLNDY